MDFCWWADLDPEIGVMAKKGLHAGGSVGAQLTFYGILGPGHNEYWYMPRTLVGWARRSALFSVITLVLLTVLDYVVGANSTAMHFARQTVIQSYALDQLVGGVEQVEMRKFWGFRRKSGFAGAHVDLYLYDRGQTGTSRWK